MSSRLEIKPGHVGETGQVTPVGLPSIVASTLWRSPLNEQRLWHVLATIHMDGLTSYESLAGLT